MLTEIGKELRKLRIDRDEFMRDMAEKLNKSSAFLSSLERGEKSPPKDFEEQVIMKYELAEEAADRLRSAADMSRKTFTLAPTNNDERDAVGLFARRMSSLSAEQLEGIKRILREGKE